MKSLWNPRSFLKLSFWFLPFGLGITGVLFTAGLYTALFTSPADYQQGEAMRIMYIHVPASWMALFIYGFLALMSGCVLVLRHPLAEVLAVSAAPIGALFTGLSLFTGALWGKPIWGTFWVWDARLTSVVVLLFFYGGYWALSRAFVYFPQGLRAASLFALMGAINLPIIKGSVMWWHTLHQPPSFMKLSSPSLHYTMLIPLLLMAGAYFFYFLCVLIMRAQTELEKRKLLIREAIT